LTEISTAAWVAEDASSEPSVDNRSLVGKLLIVYASSLDAFPSGWMMPAAEALRFSTD
jgi:hypothetical protein